MPELYQQTQPKMVQLWESPDAARAERIPVSVPTYRDWVARTRSFSHAVAYATNASVAPTPSCAYPPNVIGQSPSTAAINLTKAGFLNYIQYGDLTNGGKNKIQAQNPDATQCIPLTTLINMHYRPN